MIKKKHRQNANDTTIAEKRRREQRDIECRKKLGYSFEYNPQISLKYPPPFKTIDCLKQGVPEQAMIDPTHRYIINANTEYKCDKLKGKFSTNSIDRENTTRHGVCWRSQDDFNCAEFENECGIRDIKGNVCSKQPINVVRRKCKKTSGCRWTDVQDKKTGRVYEDCVSDISISTQHKFLMPSDWPDDITNGAIQQYLKEFYDNKGKVPAPKIQELISNENRCLQADPSKPNIPRLSAPQSVVNLVMTGIALRDPSMSNRGILAYHSTGSGKTVTSVGVVDAYWESDRNIIICTSVEGKANNPMWKFHEAALKFFPRFQTHEFVNKEWTQEQSMKKVSDAFSKRGIKYTSFAELSHFLMLYRPLQSIIKKGTDEVTKHKQFLKNGVIIVDEVHNIFKPLPTQKNENNSIKKFLITDTPDNEGMKIAILTATPGDTVEDTVELLNMIRDRRKPIIKAPKNLTDTNSPDMVSFKKSLLGLVSYFNMNGDSSKFPIMSLAQPNIANMSNKQYEKYKEEYESLAATDIERNFQQLEKDNALQRYLKTPRKYSNSLFTLDEDVTTQEFSAKVPMLLRNIDKFQKEKHYVYTAFFENRGYGGHGAKMIGNFLEKELGYEKMTPDDVFNSLNPDGTFKATMKPKKRYVLLMSSELVSDKSKVAGVNLTMLLKVFNSAMNAKGEYIHVIVASQGYNEGVDLKAVRHAHLFEPLVTFAMEQQFLGRAVRQCSHQDLSRNRGEWNVKVHRYFADKPLNMTIYDPLPLESNIQMSQNRKKDINDALDIIKGKRGDIFKEQREEGKKELKLVEQRMRDDTSRLKMITKHNLNNPVMIDQIVYDESRDRIRDILIMQKVLQSVAIDCKYLQNFHKNAGLNINCYEK